jgi:hypothetical protein
MAVVAVGVAVAVAVAGCLVRSEGGPKEPIGSTGGPAATTAPPTAAPPPTTPPAAEKLASNGVGPYQVGAKLAALKTANVLAGLNESTGCDGWATAQATAPYAGAVTIVFYNGAVNWVEVTSPAISTVEGAKVGMTLAAVKGVYGTKATELDDGLGGKAVSVHGATANGLFFRFAAGKVSTIEAGKSETLEFRFTEGEGC